VFGRKKQAMAVVTVAAEMATDTKTKHPELFCKKEGQDAKGNGTGEAGP